MSSQGPDPLDVPDLEGGSKEAERGRDPVPYRIRPRRSQTRETEGDVVNCESDPGKLGSLSASSYSLYSMRAIHYVSLGPPPTFCLIWSSEYCVYRSSNVEPACQPRNRTLAGTSQRGRVHLSRHQAATRVIDRRRSQNPELGSTTESHRSGGLNLDNLLLWSAVRPPSTPRRPLALWFKLHCARRGCKKQDKGLPRTSRRYNRPVPPPIDSVAFRSLSKASNASFLESFSPWTKVCAS